MTGLFVVCNPVSLSFHYSLVVLVQIHVGRLADRMAIIYHSSPGHGVKLHPAPQWGFGRLQQQVFHLSSLWWYGKGILLCLEVYGAAVPAESDPVLFASAEFRPVLGRRRIPTHDILFNPL